MAQKQALNNTLLLITSQTTYATMLTPAAGDVVETIGPPKMNPNFNQNPVELVAGAFDQDASVHGVIENELSFSIYARAKAADDPGQFGRMLRLAQFTQAEGSDGIFTYTPNSTAPFVDGTADLYSGALGTSLSTRRLSSNIMFSPKFSQEAGKPAMMELTGKGTFNAPAVAGTQPTITKERTLPSTLLGATTLTINNDTDYKLLSWEIDCGQEIQLTKDPTNTYGNGVSVPTNRKISWSAKVYKDIPSVVDPETALTTKSIAAWAIEYGTVPQKVKFASTYGQITEVSHSDESGVETWDLKGIFERNDFTITVSTK